MKITGVIKKDKQGEYVLLNAQGVHPISVIFDRFISDYDDFKVTIIANERPQKKFSGDEGYVYFG